MRVNVSANYAWQIRRSLVIGSGSPPHQVSCCTAICAKPSATEPCHLVLTHLRPLFPINKWARTGEVNAARKPIVRKDLLHGPGRVTALRESQVQQVDVEAIRFIGEIGRDPDRQPLGVRRAGGAVGMQPGELALVLHDLGVGVEDLREPRSAG
jgi:hypothetical protein